MRRVVRALPAAPPGMASVIGLLMLVMCVAMALNLFAINGRAAHLG